MLICERDSSTDYAICQILSCGDYPHHERRRCSPPLVVGLDSPTSSRWFVRTDQHKTPGFWPGVGDDGV